jgi:hypothetical protein
MVFTVSQTPDPVRWPVGALLSLDEAAQLLKVSASEMMTRSRMAAALSHDGIRLVIKRGYDEWEPDSEACEDY